LTDHNVTLTAYTVQYHNGTNDRIINTNTDKPLHACQTTHTKLTTKTKTKQTTN